jgi:hypothetical protein
MKQNEFSAFHSEVHEFKQNILDKYGIRAYVISDAKDKTLDLKTLEECIVKVMEEEHPEWLPYWRSTTLKTRASDFVTYCTIFSFFARGAGYTYAKIGNYINRKHCSVMHQCQTAKHRLITGDPVFMYTYVKVSKRISQYVGIIPENTKA